VFIGTIVRSNSHVSYLCRIYGRLEVEDVPAPERFAFGTFVTLEPGDTAMRLVGVVRDTLLINPEYGNFGPRLSSDQDLEVLSPDYLDEKGVLVEVLILGWMSDGTVFHGVPPLAAQVGTRVETIDRPEIERFHQDTHGRFLMGYLPQVVMRNDPMVASLLLSLLEQLEPSFPAQSKVIGVLKNNLAWKARVVPVG
jgi:hypothetical protein